MRKKISFLILVSYILASLCGCSQVKSPVTKTGIYFDTLISITLYENNSSELIDECFNLADKYDKMFSKTIPDSDVARLNSSYNEWISVAPETFYCVTHALEYEDISDGRFSVMCGALTQLWDVKNHSETTSLPSEDDIKAAKKLCGKNTLDIDVKNSALRINTKGAQLDLGAVAKGYIADQMKEYLISQGVKSGIIQLGGNVLLIGENPSKENRQYTIGITKPFSDSNDVITAVTTSDCSIVTSGNYQRYFEYEGKIYHHIIDLSTGYPSVSGLNSVTVICQKSIDADILSTVCFVSGYEKSCEILNSFENTRAIFVDSNNRLIN